METDGSQFSAAGVDACEGGGSNQPLSDKPSDGGRNWAANGETMKCTQTSGKDTDHFAISDRNRHAKNSGSVDMTTGLPGDLTTPPLTPPREPLPPTSEPVNGNRNNVSDSVHANSANYKTTKQLDPGAGVGVATDGTRKHLTEASEELARMNSPMHTPSPKMETTPPALVVISDRTGEEDEEEMAPGKNDPAMDKPDAFQDRREATPPASRSPYVSAGYTSGTAKGQNEVTSLQSMQVTSAGVGSHERDALSSEEEDMEDVELVLVEDVAEEELRERERSRRRGNAAEGSKRVCGDGAGSRDVRGGMREGYVGVSPRRGHHQPRDAAAVVMNGRKEPSQNGHSKKPSPELESPSQGSDGYHRRDEGEMGAVRTMHATNAKQAAKVKQFFNTIQQHGNKLGSEVAEQVQELIHALMNETATVEEFHQEIQTIMNYPLKDFIIPFLRDNVHYFRAELKESSQVLADVLGSGDIPATSTAITLTPQLVDDELPVVPSSTSKHSSIRTISSSSLNSASKTTPSSSSSASIRTSVPHSNSTVNHTHGTGSSTQSHSHHGAGQYGNGNGGHSHSHFSSGGDEVDRHHGHSSRHQVRTAMGGTSTVGGVKRRRWSVEQGPNVMSADKDKEMGQDKTMPKRIRTDEGNIIITTPRPPPPPPSYHHAPPPPPVTHLVAVSQPPASGENHVAYASFSQDIGQRRQGRGMVLSEDWGHIDMMLTSVQGMLEKTRQSMAVLKERVTSTHIEMERREHERESIIQQRVGEAADKIQLQSNEEKQRLLMDASKQMRDAVSAAKNEMEKKFQQAQSLSIQEALKEHNVQSSSKEHCWNCGRRATETCSGCNKARYCGTFCQHKDWANHMHHCASGVQQEETSRELKRVIHAPLPTGEVARVSSNRVVAAQQHHRTVAIPMNLISPQEVNLRLARPSDVLIKTERT